MKLKKLLVCAMATMMVAASTLTAFAAELTAEEKAVIQALTDAKVPAEYITQAENYLAKDDVTVTADQATAIKKEIADAKATVGTTDLAKLTADQKSAIVADIEAAAAAVNLKVEVNSAKEEVKIVDAKGNAVANVAATDAPFQDTGADMSTTVAVLAVLGVALVACAVASKKVANN